ncbi:MAG: hypothetical protein K2J11_09585, partial [Oscillospiraceae bacterium]|nr:hypothetical protein [Oscillospiraceae bacterium]
SAEGDQRAPPSGLLPPLKRRAKLFHSGFAARGLLVSALNQNLPFQIDFRYFFQNSIPFLQNM